MDGDYRRRLQFSPIFIGILGVIAGAIVVGTYHYIAAACSNRRRAAPRPPSLHHLAPQTGQDDRPSNTSNSIVQQLLPLFKYCKETEQEICAVCLCEFKEAEEIRVLPECLHLFHVTCIDTWLNFHSNCPLCRADTSPSPHTVLSLPNISARPLPNHQDLQDSRA